MKFTFLWRKQTKQFNSVKFYLEKLKRVEGKEELK